MADRWLLFSCAVDGGFRGVIWDRFNGVQDKVYGEGTHFRIPFMQVCQHCGGGLGYAPSLTCCYAVQYPTTFDVRMRPRVVSSRTGTKDMQMVNISLRVLSRPVEEELPVIFKDLGENWDDRVLPSIVNEVLKAVVAQHDAHQLLTQREEVSRMIAEQLNERSSEFHCILDGTCDPACVLYTSRCTHRADRRPPSTDVSITHLAFGREFTRAIEAKQVAQQESERAKFVVAKAEQLKQAAIIRAEGESEAAELISAALAMNGTGLIEVRRIDVSRWWRSLGLLCATR